MQLKTTAHPLEWLEKKPQKLTILSVGKDAKLLEHSYTAGVATEWYNHSGKRFGITEYSWSYLYSENQ